MGLGIGAGRFNCGYSISRTPPALEHDEWPTLSALSRGPWGEHGPGLSRHKEKVVSDPRVTGSLP